MAIDEHSHGATEVLPNMPASLDVAIPRPVEWLDRLKVAKGFHADIALADYLGVSKNLFSQWRTGKTEITVDEAWRIGNELGINPLRVIASVGFHSASPEKRPVWMSLVSTVLTPSRSSGGGNMPAYSPAAPTSLATHNGPVTAKIPGRESQGSKWTKEEDDRLANEYASLTPIPDIAVLHRRSVAAVLYRLYKNLNLMTDEVMVTQCNMHGVRFQPRVQSETHGLSGDKEIGDVFL